MKKFNVLLITIIFITALFGKVKSQDYIWPTDASFYLTSSFAEYRPGHFHAGIDIKTWGKIGYKVFAVRDGYISRIRTSPFGYGKVIYQKLDNGETVVYAHLSRFNNELDKFVKQEQKRKGEYRINKYLNSTRFPVKKGDVIAYTGATGIGHPHLHFEMRDANNNPINPFLKGYSIKDNVPPTVDAISITPLDVYSKVNFDVIPWIKKPAQKKGSHYKILSKPLLSGKIGFAVKCFDKADGVNNTFSVYKLDFYVDGELKYSASYDRFSYGVSKLIDFDRDYRLRKRGFGLFQNLYKVKYNKLPFYKPKGEQIGILKCDPKVAGKTINSNIIGKGEHQFRIELFDFWGNLSTVTGTFVVGEREYLTANFISDNAGELLINNLKKNNGDLVVTPEFFISKDSGKTWGKSEFIKIFADSLINSTENFVYKINNLNSHDILKIIDTAENSSVLFPLFHVVKGNGMILNSEKDLLVEKDFYDDYMRLKVIVPGVADFSPDVFVQQLGNPPTEIKLFQKSVNEFVGAYPLRSNKKGPLSIYASIKNVVGEEINHWEQFDLQTITPFDGGEIISKDEKCRVTFAGNKVYKNLFLRIEKQDPIDDSTYDSVGDVYKVFPNDVLLKGSARLAISYPQNDTLPEKLGIYSGSKNRWGFIGKNLDSLNSIISCNISNLNTYTLIRDVNAPIISVRQPLKNGRLKENTPKFVIKIYDELSGIASERSIKMILDGKKVIPEYDPETKSIKYKCETPLIPGSHQFVVTAVDNCQNESKVVQSFYVLN